MLIPRLRNRPLNEIRRADVVKTLDEYSNRPARRKEIHSLLRKLINWATDRQDIRVSPLAGMKAPKAVPSRRRVLNEEEIVALWRASEKAGWPWGKYVRMLILTMQRRCEVAEMDWSEIDLDARKWNLPASRAKNDEEHIVPLSDLAMQELRRLSPKCSGLVFTTTGGTPLSGFFKGKASLHEDMVAYLREQ